MAGAVTRRSTIGASALVFAVACIGFIVLAYTRSIASDEGFYAMAAQRVAQGHMPYRDFFYPQAPLLPYLYGLLFALGSPSWQLARLCTALMSSLSALFLFRIGIRCSLSIPIALLGALLFFASTLTIIWFPTVKIFSSTSLFLLGSLYAISVADEKRDARYYLLSGLLLGLACGIRSYVIVCVVPFAIYMSSKETYRYGLWFLGGLALGLLPHAFFFLLDADRYLYNNLGYHLDRSTLPDHERVPQKLRTLGRLFGVLEDRETPGIQYGLLVLCSLGSLLALRKAVPKAALTSFLLACSIFVISLLPTPTWQQYFCLTVPFFILPIVVGLQTALEKKKTFVVVLLSFWTLSHCIAGGIEYYAHYTGKKRLPGPEKAALYPLALDSLGDRLDQKLAPGTTLFSLWPGHLFGTKLTPVLGMENQFWVRVPRSVDVTDRKYYHLMSPKQVRSLLKEQKLPFILSGRRNRYTPDALLQERGYSRFYQDPDVDISLWKRSDDS